MTTGWINIVAHMETADAPLFEHILMKQISSNDATYQLDDRLYLAFPSEEDDVLFRLALLDETNIDEIHHVGDLLNVLPVRLSDDVHRLIGEGLFEGDAALLTMARLELRDDDVRCCLGAGLEAERSSFAGQVPALLPVGLCRLTMG